MAKEKSKGHKMDRKPESKSGEKTKQHGEHIGRDGRHHGAHDSHKAITSQKGYTHDCSK
jgi:hypothetical protein